MAAAAARELRVVNPATLEEVGTVAALDPSLVPGLAAEAAVRQERWGATPPAERVAVLRRLRQAVLRRASEIAACVRAAADAFRGALGVLYGDGGIARLKAAWTARRSLAALTGRYRA